MCRLLGVVSRDSRTLAAATAAWREPFTEQSAIHKDGWGVAWFTGDGSAEAGPRTPQIRRRLDVARESAAYADAFDEATGPMMLVHLRKASPGMPLRIENTHPFREGETVFAHNGQFDLSDELREAILARGGRTPEGTTDSELFFSLVELHARTLDPAAAVQEAAAELTALCLEHGGRVPESLNCLCMTPDVMVAYQQSDRAQARPNHTEDNYTLRCRVDEDRVLVASSGIPQDDCFDVGEGRALVIERDGPRISTRPPLAETRAA